MGNSTKEEAREDLVAYLRSLIGDATAALAYMAEGRSDETLTNKVKHAFNRAERMCVSLEKYLDSNKPKS